MARMAASTATWAVICGPSRARILRGLDAAGPRRVALTLRARQENLRRLVAVPTGRWLGGPDPGAARACLDADLRSFAAGIAALLEAHRLAGDFAWLVITAPTPMLPLLHEACAPGLHGCVLAELAADLVATGEEDLRRRLAALISAPRA